MRVLTMQSDDLRDRKDPIELDRGTYNDQPDICRAQRKLYDLLEEDQVVWCAQNDRDLSFEGGKFYHEIDIDRRDIVAVIDYLVWHNITDPGWIPPDVVHELWKEAVESGEDDRMAVDRRLRDQYLKDNLPDDLWSAVKKGCDQLKNSDTLLVKFPFKFSTIVCVRQL